MRLGSREREEHPAGDERRRGNGVPRHAEQHGPPRRPSHQNAARPPLHPRGRVARSFARLIGLLATAVLLAVGVSVVLMVTDDKGTTAPPETFAAPNPTAAPKKAKPGRPKAPTLTPAERASRDAAVKQLRIQGYEPVSLADYKPHQSLRVLLGRAKKSTGIKGLRAFFFVRGDYLGTDAASPSLRVRVARQRGGVITLRYTLFMPGDKPAHPTGRATSVRFTMADGRLVPEDVIPSVSSRLPPS